MKTRVDVVKCGNCQYWTGAREPVFDEKGQPKVEIRDLKGSCENQNSQFCDKTRGKGQKCKDFYKWTELF